MLSNYSSDEELWNGVMTDDERAFNLLFDRYWKKIYATAYRHLNDRDSSQEITQEIFVTLWNQRKTLKINSFKNYLNAAAKYKVYKNAKALKASPVIYHGDMAELPTSSNQGEANLQTAELQRDLNHYLALLPKRCREIFIMSRIEQLSNDEIADKLRISKRTVENQLTQALKHLRSAMKYVHIILIYMLLR